MAPPALADKVEGGLPVRIETMRGQALARPPRRERVRDRKSILVALDSDGSVFDTMGSKHEACFAPSFAVHFGAGAPYPVLLEVWRFVNLESRSRGQNRYRALAQALRLLASHPELGPPKPLWRRNAEALEAWLSLEPSPSRASLAREVLRGKALGRALVPILEWSAEVDAAIALLPPPPPFKSALAALPMLARKAELIVLSSGPTTMIRAEWKRVGALEKVNAVLGQERGSKAQALAAYVANTAEGEDRPRDRRILLIGDAFGDLETARSLGTAFFPILPGREEECWSLLIAEGFERFLVGETAPGPGLLTDFLATPASDPPWRFRCS